MLKNGLTLLAAVLLGVLLFTNNAASVPLEFTHQGRLLDAADKPVNGFFDIEYRLYDAGVGGNLLWTETHNGVKVTDGLFIVELGTISSFFDVFTDPPPPGWLQIQIVGEATPISPRTKLSGSPYAILANGVSSSHHIGGSLDTAKIDMQTSDAGASLRLRVVPTAQTTGRGVSAKATQQGGEIAIGDPDFDLLRMTGDATGANVSITGDPDFDLLRLSANADSAKIRISGQSSGDPDFDLLRISGGGGSGGSGGSEIAMGGDPDFDLLRMTAGPDSAKIRISGQSSGDPDFDLLRISGGGGSGGSGGSAIAMGGDPDFDLLRMTAGPDSAKIRISGQSIGDPDFDLLRIVAGKGNGDGASMTLTGDPDFDLLRMSADADSAEIKMSGQVIGDPDFDLLRFVTRGSVGDITMKVKNSIGNIRGVTTEVDSAAASYHHWSWASGSVKRNMIELSSDDETGTMSISNAQGTKGIASRVNNSGGSIAIEEEGVQKINMNTDSGHAELAIGEEGVQITMRADSGGAGRIAILAGVAVPKFLVDSDGDGYVATRFGIGIQEPANPLGLASGAHCTVGGVFTNASDKNLKENFEEVNGENLLEKIESLDISEWNYKNEADDIKHIGPTAQDFYKAFGVGGDDKSISTVDPSGIALAAIKELYKKSKEVDDLKKQLEELTRQVEKLAKQKK